MEAFITEVTPSGGHLRRCRREPANRQHGKPGENENDGTPRQELREREKR